MFSPQPKKKKILNLPLLPLSHLLVLVKALCLLCQSHCSSRLVALGADITGPIGVKPLRAVTPPNHLLSSRPAQHLSASVSHMESGV